MRTRANLAVAAAFCMLFSACQQDSTVPITEQASPEIDHALIAGSVRVHIDLENGTTAIVGTTTNKNINADVLSAPSVTVLTTAPVRTSVNGKDIVRFDASIRNDLLDVTLTTSTNPAPPSGVSGLLLVPAAIKVTSGAGSVDPVIDWDGPLMKLFVNNSGNCVNANAPKGCFPIRAFAGDLDFGQTTAARTIGFELTKNVKSFDVTFVVIADKYATPFGAVAGTVSSSQRGPTAGAVVTLSNGQNATTDADGKYAISHVRAADYTANVTVPSVCTAPAAQNVTVADNTTSTVNFDITCTIPLGNISGRVASVQRGLLANVTVTSGGVSTQTDANGEYTLTGVHAGAQTVAVSNLPPFCPTTPAGIPANVVEGQTTEHVDFSVTCNPPVGKLEGVVKSSPDGIPVANVKLTVTGSALTLTTGADGKFDFGELPVGAGTLAVDASNAPCHGASVPTNILENQVQFIGVGLVCPPPTVVVNENGKLVAKASYTITLTTTSTNNVPLTYDWNGGYGSGPTFTVTDDDYGAESGFVTVSDGVHSTTVNGTVYVVENPNKAIFVSTAGLVTNNGSMQSPLRTIGGAISMAAADPNNIGDVYVMGGGYAEPVITLRSGVSIIGTFNPQWERNPLNVKANITVTGGGVMTGNGVTDVAIDGVHVMGFAGPGPTQFNATGLFLTNSTVTIKNSMITAGNARPGTSAAPVPPSQSGTNGGFGGLPGGSNGGVGGSGGAGGFFGGQGGAGASTFSGNGLRGGVGFGLLGGAGGSPGSSCTATFFCAPTGGGQGLVGAGGGNGAVGAHAAYALATQLTATGFVPVGGVSGTSGSAGSGGGGGGGGGARNCELCGPLAPGSGGGGGGGGGVGGAGGVAGTGGGSAIALYLVNSTVTSENSAFVTQSGGLGGIGSSGGPGGNGGAGGQGAPATNGGAAGGNGGNGGKGGNGGAAGGGAGGSSIGVARVGSSVFNFNPANTFFNIGPAGNGGSGALPPVFFAMAGIRQDVF